MENLNEQIAELLDKMEFSYDFDEGLKAFLFRNTHGQHGC